MMPFCKIVLLAIAVAIGYGVLNDQITVRICREYFTIGKPPLFSTSSPTMLGLGWGIVATWWVGVLIGIAVAICARWGSSARLQARDLICPGSALLIAVIVMSVLAGAAGYIGARTGLLALTEPLSSRVPEASQAAFTAVGWAHSFAYGGVIGGTVVLCQWIWRQRNQVPAN